MVTQQVTEHQGGEHGHWYDYAPHSVGVLVIGLILAHYRHFLSGRRDFKIRPVRAKDAFSSVIAKQRARLASMPRREDVFFVDSILPLSEAVFELQDVLSSDRWTRLRDILRHYEAHGREQFGGTREMLAAFLDTGQKPEDRLNALLDRFYECVADKKPA